jgi:hypothetical protein
VAETVQWSPQALVAETADALATEAIAVERPVGTGLSYLLVEELVRGQAHLQRWPWPAADREGRLVWSVARPLGEVAVAVDLLRWQLYQPQADGLRRRPRAGDVFAVRWSAARTTRSRVTDLRTLFTEAYDVSADAREAAKLAYLAVQATQLDPPPVDEAEVLGPTAEVAAAPRLLVVPPPEGER